MASSGFHSDLLLGRNAETGDRALANHIRSMAKIVFMKTTGHWPASMNRRDLLKGVAGAGMAVALGPLAGCAAVRPGARDLIRSENAKLGTTDWLLTHTRADPKTK